MPYILITILFVIGLIIVGVFNKAAGRKPSAEETDATMTAIFWIVVVVVVIFGIVCMFK